MGQMNIIGIDPGLKGGLFCIHPDSSTDMTVMPVVKTGKKSWIDEAVLLNWFTSHRPAQVFVELVHSMPKQGVASMFTFGLGYGIARGICVGLGLSYELVTPQAWQRFMLAGHPRGSEYLVASRLWPQVDWKRTPRCTTFHDGLVDAALIAEYGRRRLRR